MLDFQIREIESVGPTEAEESALPVERERLLHADRIRSAGEAALAALTEAEGAAADRLGEAARAFANPGGDRSEPRRPPGGGRGPQAADRGPRRGRAGRRRVRRRRPGAADRDRDAPRAARPAQAQVRPERLGAPRPALRHEGGTRGALARRRGAGPPPPRSREVRGGLSEGRGGSLAKAAGRRQPDSRRPSRRSCAGLALEKAKLRLALETLPDDRPRPGGLETGAFLFAPNPGETEKPLEKIASGGELSRLQLAIRSVASGRGRGRTLVFDEVDAGIGGRVAEVVGRKLRALADSEQVLCVTHVPQIAALARTHLRAEKREIGGRTVASVRRLDARERVAEIARMLAGETIPETAMKHARTLLEAAR